MIKRCRTTASDAIVSKKCCFLHEISWSLERRLSARSEVSIIMNICGMEIWSIGVDWIYLWQKRTNMCVSICFRRHDLDHHWHYVVVNQTIDKCMMTGCDYWWKRSERKRDKILKRSTISLMIWWRIFEGLLVVVFSDRRYWSIWGPFIGNKLI